MLKACWASSAGSYVPCGPVSVAEPITIRFRTVMLTSLLNDHCDRVRFGKRHTEDAWLQPGGAVFVPFVFAKNVAPLPSIVRFWRFDQRKRALDPVAAARRET